MPDIVIESVGVSKKFRKGELYDSLRDFLPVLAGKILKRDNTTGLEKKEFFALQDISFQVKRGDSLGIIGDNGAGKSTLLKILSKIMKPTSGEIKVNGKLSALIEVGAGFHQDLTGKENIFLNGLILGMSRQEVKQKFDEIVDFSGLSDFIDTPVKRYSSGMYARLGFSVAAHVNPEILLVDEVLSVGDWGFQKKCNEKMSGMTRSGVTIIFISHNLRAITDICSSCFLLERGNIIKNGIPDDVVKYYLAGGSKINNESNNKKVSISEVTVHRNGNVDSRFSSGEKAILNIKVSSKIIAHDLGLHVYLRDNNDYQIFHAYLELLDCAGFSLIAGESREFNVELSMHLAAGVYQLGIMVVNCNDVSNILDHKFPAAKLYIESHDAIRCVANLYPKFVSA